MGWSEDLDNEDAPRNAGAIRTALLLGAEFVQDERGYWATAGVNNWSVNRTMPAWLYLATCGVGIDEHGSPVQFSKAKIEDAGPCKTYYTTFKIMNE